MFKTSKLLSRTRLLETAYCSGLMVPQLAPGLVPVPNQTDFRMELYIYIPSFFFRDLNFIDSKSNVLFGYHRLLSRGKPGPFRDVANAIPRSGVTGKNPGPFE